MIDCLVYVHQHHGIDRRRGFLLDHGSPPRYPGSGQLEFSSSSSGGDIYIACPFWEGPFKPLVFLRPHVYRQPCTVNETPRASLPAHVDTLPLV